MKPAREIANGNSWLRVDLRESLWGGRLVQPNEETDLSALLRGVENGLGLREIRRGEIDLRGAAGKLLERLDDIVLARTVREYSDHSHPIRNRPNVST